MTTTTTLPKISPLGTPRMTPLSTPMPTMQRSTSMYGAYPPRELSSSMSLVRIPQRINPLAPPPPKKRINDSWETVEQHFHNDSRRILMQQREHQRYHSAWSKPFYGGPAEKEQYRSVTLDVYHSAWSKPFYGGPAEKGQCRSVTSAVSLRVV